MYKPLLIQEIPYHSPWEYFLAVRDHQHLVFLDSNRAHPTLGRYSYLLFEPSSDIRLEKGQLFVDNKLISQKSPLAYLGEIYLQNRMPTTKNIPPFQGGMAGYFSYELGYSLDTIHSNTPQFASHPDFHVGIYDIGVAFDHVDKRAWYFSSGLPANDSEEQLEQQQKRMAYLEHLFAQPTSPFSPGKTTLAPEAISSNFNARTYKEAVSKMIEYILTGDIFEANFTQKFSAKLPDSLTPLDLYHRLRTINSAPFSAYVKMDDKIILSASPERFLHLDATGLVETRPIKGTRPRLVDELADKKMQRALLSSKKDCAENTMIVDLMRNDLSKVCTDDSIEVPQLCSLESYATVHHLVSSVAGKLTSDKTPIDLLAACFPGGSITGAPKIRAMEIIAKLEQTCRGPYCGSIACIGFNGTMDSSILIRSYFINGKTITFNAGGAITVDSDPFEEYQESLDKVQALKRALQEAVA